MSKVETDNTVDEKVYQDTDIKNAMDTVSHAYGTSIWKNVTITAIVTGIIASAGLIIVKGCNNE